MMITKITNDEEYRKALQEFDKFWIYRPCTPFWKRRCQLARIISKYEEDIDNVDEQNRKSILFKIFDWIMRL